MTTATARIRLSSPAFASEASIPKEHAYRGEGGNVSPGLSWSDLPQGTKELALTMDDPDAPGRTWVHWVIYGIPPGAKSLHAGVPGKPALETPKGARQGANSYDEIGYGGPMPPRGLGPHRYRFTIYALDKELDLRPGLTRDKLLKAMEGHIIGQGELVGLYERK